MALIHEIDHPGVGGIRVGQMDKKGNYRLTGSCIVYQLGNTVIDTGPAKEWPVVSRFFENKAINQALITHYHEDHSGNGQQFQQHFGCRVHSHPNSHRHLEQGFKLSMIRKMAFGKVKQFKPDELENDYVIDSGHHLKPLHMPGHSDDMSCFYEPNEGWLFSGDLYISSQIKYMMIEEDVSKIISSLQHALTLDFDTLFCAHRGVVNDGQKALAKKLDFIQSLREEVSHLHQKGHSARQITRQLLGREDMTSYISSLEMSKRNVVNACLRSLES